MKNIWNVMKHKISGLRDFGFLGSANIIGTGISAFFWFYLANIINEGDYGEINYFIGIAGIAYLFSSVAAPHTITVLTAKNVNIHSTLYLLSLIVGFVSFLVTLLIFHRTDIGLLIFGYLIYDLGLYYLLGRKLYARYSREFIIQKILTVVFGFGFNHFFGHETIIYGLALSYIPFTVIVYRLFRDSKIDFSLLKSHKGFITNNYFENVVGGLNGQIDKIIIAPLLGFVILGNYALAMQVYAVLMIFSNVAFKYILPQDASGGVSTKLKRSVICVSVAISVFGIIVLPIILPHFFPKYTDTEIHRYCKHDSNNKYCHCASYDRFYVYIQVLEFGEEQVCSNWKNNSISSHDHRYDYSIKKFWYYWSSCNSSFISLCTNSFLCLRK